MPRPPRILLQVLDELVDNDLDRFVFFLYQDPLYGFPSIPRSKVQQKPREEVINVMIQMYEDKALDVTERILKKMHKNKLAHKIQKQKQRKRKKPDPNAVPSKNLRVANSPIQRCQPAEVRNTPDKGKDAL